jgi:hypothetical protein
LKPIAGYFSDKVARLVGDLVRDAHVHCGAAEPSGFAIVGAVRSGAARRLADPTLTRESLSAYRGGVSAAARR